MISQRSAKRRLWKPLPRAFRTHNRRKYDDSEMSSDLPKLSESDQKKLARLVRKYGCEAVAAAAKKAPPAKPARGPGRPSRIFERMWLAGLIDEWAEENRQAGSRQPYKQAEIEYYDCCYSRDEQKRLDFQKFQKKLKKDRLQGRQELQRYHANLQRWEAHLRAQKKGA
jgi:hypothetical protein